MTSPNVSKEDAILELLKQIIEMLSDIKATLDRSNL